MAASKALALVAELDKLEAELKILMGSIKETQRDLTAIELKLAKLKMQEKVARRAEILGF